MTVKFLHARTMCGRVTYRSIRVAQNLGSTDWSIMTSWTSCTAQQQPQEYMHGRPQAWYIPPLSRKRTGHHPHRPGRHDGHRPPPQKRPLSSQSGPIRSQYVQLHVASVYNTRPTALVMMPALPSRSLGRRIRSALLPNPASRLGLQP
jgi:hypothetical protein